MYKILIKINFIGFDNVLKSSKSDDGKACSLNELYCQWREEAGGEGEEWL